MAENLRRARVGSWLLTLRGLIALSRFRRV